jgi:hypothetical protein
VLVFKKILQPGQPSQTTSPALFVATSSNASLIKTQSLIHTVPARSVGLRNHPSCCWTLFPVNYSLSMRRIGLMTSPLRESAKA